MQNEAPPAYEENEDTPNTTIAYILIHEGQSRLISSAVFNNVKRTLSVSKFYDNENYVALESHLIQTNPNEASSTFKVYVRAPKIRSERKKIAEKFTEFEINFQDDKVMLHPNINMLLQKLLKDELKFYTKLTEDRELMAGLSYLLQLLELERDKSNQKQFELVRFDSSDYMKLDKACLNALLIFSKENERKILAGGSNIFDILNRCKTDFGIRCLKRWMKQPVQDPKELSRRHGLIQFFLDNSQARTIFQNHLKKLPDLEKIYFIFYRVQSEKKVRCEVTDLMKMYRAIEVIGDLVTNIESKELNGGEIEGLFGQISQSFQIISKIKVMIEKFIDMNTSRESEYLVRADAEPALTAAAKSMRETRKKIDAEKSLCQEQLKTDVQIIESASYKYVFESVKKGVVEKVKQYKGFKFISAKQTRITFTTDQMVQLCKEYMALEVEYKDLQQEVLQKIFKIVAGYYPVLEQLSVSLAELDVLSCWASIVSSSAQKWCMPEITEAQCLSIWQMRHPCVKNCVPNDLVCGKDEKTIILTGPNMGGKSTFIRTVGICCYLAHIGMFVPAQNFTTPIVDAIICRVGASDEQVKGISTFMSEMLETNCMLKTATSKSLVLIDELGRGTSTNEGFGISWALCKYLHQNINPFCLFATHFHQMVSIADEVKGISNMYTQTEVSSGSLEFKYKVCKGKMQKSYGVQVAQMVGFPESIIKEAYEYLELFENQRNSLTHELNPEVLQAIDSELETLMTEIKKYESEKQLDSGKGAVLSQFYDRIENLIKSQTVGQK